jgi:glutamate formiminotransferase/formiminotetrahydrofolate cyclodeaminase
MAEIGNPNSISDAGVGALCARSAVIGAYMNVRINSAELKDEVFKKEILAKAEKIKNDAIKEEEAILKIVYAVI